LRAKDKRDHEQALRSRGYPSGRKIEYVDEEDSEEESLVMDKAAVTRQFDIGFNELGLQFAVGDGKQARYSLTRLENSMYTAKSCPRRLDTKLS
jgi:hypothetical protein